MCHLGSLITIWPAVHNQFCFCLRCVFLVFLIYWCRWAYCQPALRWFSPHPKVAGTPLLPCWDFAFLIGFTVKGIGIISRVSLSVLWWAANRGSCSVNGLFYLLFPLSAVDWGLKIFTGTEFNICLKLTFNTDFLNGVPTTDTIHVFLIMDNVYWL